MITNGDRVRAAARAAAATVPPDSAPPLRLPAPPRRRRWRPGPGSRLQSLTPLMAAVGVIAVLAASLALTGSFTGHRAAPRDRALTAAELGAGPALLRRPQRPGRRAAQRGGAGHGHRAGAGHGHPAPAVSRVHVPERCGRRAHVRARRPAVVADRVGHSRDQCRDAGRHHPGRFLPAPAAPGHRPAAADGTAPAGAAGLGPPVRHRAVPGRPRARAVPACSRDPADQPGHRGGTGVGLARCRALHQGVGGERQAGRRAPVLDVRRPDARLPDVDQVRRHHPGAAARHQVRRGQPAEGEPGPS